MAFPAAYMPSDVFDVNELIAPSFWAALLGRAPRPRLSASLSESSPSLIRESLVGVRSVAGTAPYTRRPHQQQVPRQHQFCRAASPSRSAPRARSLPRTVERPSERAGYTGLSGLPCARASLFQTHPSHRVFVNTLPFWTLRWLFAFPSMLRDASSSFELTSG